MKITKHILLLIALLVVGTGISSAQEESKELTQGQHTTAAAEESKELNIPEIVLEHLADSYDWHIATYEGKHISIPLPIILRSDATGDWTCILSQGAHTQLPEPYFFNEEAHGKIYEKMPDGSITRPIDLSITKAVAQIWIVVAVILIVFLSCARWYKHHNEKDEAPRGFVGLMELFIMYIHDDLICPLVGEHAYKKFAPYLLTVFFFIFTCNVIGLIPIFPGGANVTGNINITLFLAVCTMLAINIFGNKHYWKEILWPEVPVFLKAPVPLMPVIEVFGIFTKPFALMIRLFANMMAGHAVILSFTCVIFLGCSLGIGYGIGLGTFSVIMLLFMNMLEVLVAFIQAYVFTLLSAVFIGMAQVQHHEE